VTNHVTGSVRPPLVVVSIARLEPPNWSFNASNIAVTTADA